MSSIIVNHTVILASPSDVPREREIVHNIIDKLKEEFKENNITFTLKRWETDADPGFHPKGGQGKIDEVLKIFESDLFIGIFYKKVGTPVFDSPSGSQHELKQAIESWKEKGSPDIKLYFKKALIPIDELKDNEIDDFKRIRDLKKELYQYGILQEYETENDFEEMIEKHLRNFLKSKLNGHSVQKYVQPTNNKNELEQLIEIFKQEEQFLDYKSQKEEIQRVEDLKSKIYKEIFQSLDEKREQLPNIYNQLPKLIFEKVFAQQKVEKDLLNDINELRHNTERYKWFDRSLVVSGVTLGLLCNNEFDNKKCHILIDFILDFEDNVWQRALTGLVLTLIKNQNKVGRFNDIISRLKTIQNNEEVQKGILLLEIILRERIYLYSIFDTNVYEFDFFKNDVANCFLPFYDENPILTKALDQSAFDFDTDSFKHFILDAPLVNAHKYSICMSENFGVKKIEKVQNEKVPRYFQNCFLSLISIGHIKQSLQNSIISFKTFHNMHWRTFSPKNYLLANQKLRTLFFLKYMN
jgi:hypothetical protein